MIDIKPPEEEKPTNLYYQQLEKDSLQVDLNLTEEQRKDFNYFIERQDELLKSTRRKDVDVDVAKELHELNKTLREILREMRKRK
jgi:type IV secretory pathway VirB9-like protein